MSIPCSHWRDCGVIGGGCCAAGVFDRPSFGVCLQHCTQYDGPPRAGIAEMLVRGLSIPISHRGRHAQVLTGAGGSRPLYRHRPRPKMVWRPMPAKPQPGPVCPKCGGLRGAAAVQPKRSDVIAARPGDERRYAGDHVQSILAQVGITKCPKWVPGSCDERKATLNNAHRAVASGVRRLIAPITNQRRVLQ